MCLGVSAFICFIHISLHWYLLWILLLLPPGWYPIYYLFLYCYAVCHYYCSYMYPPFLNCHDYWSHFLELYCFSISSTGSAVFFVIWPPRYCLAGIGVALMCLLFLLITKLCLVSLIVYALLLPL